MRGFSGRGGCPERAGRPLIAALLLGAVWWSAAGRPSAETAGASSGLKVVVERLGAFHNAGDPVPLRVAVFNTGTAPHDNAAGLDLLGNLIVQDAGGAALKHRASPSAPAKVQPAVIAAGGFFGFITDLREVVEGLDKPGAFHVRFKTADLESDAVTLKIIERYDPAVAYRASVETDYGRLEFDLLGRDAPKHVHNFHDLARQGYYDGTLFHLIAKGLEVRGGDRTGDGTSHPGYGLDPEVHPDLKCRRGTLTMLRGPAGDHGAQFSIALSENPAMNGKVTIFGELASGEETLAALENLPTSGGAAFPFYRPLSEARIRSVSVGPAPAGSRATSEAGEAKAGEVKAPAAP